MVRTLKTRSDFLSVGTDIKINELKEYLETVKKQLEIVGKDYDKHIEEQAQKINGPRMRDEFYEFSSDRHFNYTETFPRILLNSFHVMAYTLLESEICSVANLVGKKQNQLINISDLPGRDYLRNASNYIKKLTQVKAQDFNSWNAVDDGRHIRNVIVHSNGKITNQHDLDLAKNYNFIDNSTLEFPSLRPTQRLTITYEYCQQFIQSLKSFFSELYSEMDTGDFL